MKGAPRLGRSTPWAKLAAAEREAVRRRSAVVQGLDDWAEAHVGERTPTPTRMSATFSAYMTEELGRPVTHSIEVPGHPCQYALGADAARELALSLLLRGEP